MTIKLLDYGKPNPFGEIIGKPNHLAWPVHAYRLTLPKPVDAGDGLNSFERVILKLLDAVGKMDERALAEETCIPDDLVKGILLRLRDKGFINEHNAIVEREKQRDERGVRQVPEFASALLFRELITGKILPFLHILDDSNPLRKRENTNYAKTIKANQNYKRSVPSPQDVIRSLRSMKKRALAFGMDERLPSVQKITIAQKPELYHLDCPIAFRKSDADWRIADPFGNGYSLVLESSFESLLAEDERIETWFTDWQKSLQNPQPSKKKNSEERPKQPFESDINWQRYPELIPNLRPGKNSAFRSRRKIHAALEWALYYTCIGRPYEKVIARLRLTEQSDHTNLLEEAAQAIGLEPPTLCFRAVPQGKLRGFLEVGDAEFGVVLAISMLQAELDESHPLRRVAQSHPDLIQRLFAIKRRRDDKSHGQGGADTADIEIEDDAFMREVVHMLLPDIHFEDTPVKATNMDARADSLLESRASIRGEFGSKTFNRLTSNVRERLIQAERFCLASDDGDNADAFASDLYGALQGQFSIRFSEILPPDIPESEIIKVAQNRSRKASLGDLPDCLRNVQSWRVRNTLQGRGETLGACVLAFLLMEEDCTLRSVSDAQPTFITDLEQLIQIRGHGGHSLPLSKGETAKLRKAAYTTIKTLQET